MSRVLQGINGIQSTEDHSLDVYPVNVLVIQEAVNQILVRPNKINYLVLWPLFLKKKEKMYTECFGHSGSCEPNTGKAK